MIKLGSKVRDHITGFEGIAVARTTWLYGCNRIVIEPTSLDKDGSPVKPESFDEQRIELLEERAPFVAPVSEATSGGPYPEATRND